VRDILDQIGVPVARIGAHDAQDPKNRTDPQVDQNINAIAMGVFLLLDIMVVNTLSILPGVYDERAVVTAETRTACKRRESLLGAVMPACSQRASNGTQMVGFPLGVCLVKSNSRTRNIRSPVLSKEVVRDIPVTILCGVIEPPLGACRIVREINCEPFRQLAQGGMCSVSGTVRRSDKIA